MAFVQFINGKCRSLPNDKATELWLYMNNESQGTPALAEYAKTVKHIWLNRHNAPPSYIATIQKRRGLENQASLRL